MLMGYLVERQHLNLHRRMAPSQTGIDELRDQLFERTAVQKTNPKESK